MDASVELLERGVEVVAELEGDVGCGLHHPGDPADGATAIMVPRISSVVASASRAASTLHW